MATTITVTGMTCQHCVASVTEELLEVPGVTGVEVDLTTGKVNIAGEGFTREQLATAVAEADPNFALQ